MEPTHGATYGDALIVLIGFAERHPWRFLLTIPITLGLALVFMVLMLKIVVIGPIGVNRAQYDTRRREIQRSVEPGPPP